jgi:hypothetical protein
MKAGQCGRRAASARAVEQRKGLHDGLPWDVDLRQQTRPSGTTECIDSSRRSLCFRSAKLRLALASAVRAWPGARVSSDGR